jgi:Protein of unknown function (DUF2012)
MVGHLKRSLLSLVSILFGLFSACLGGAAEGHPETMTLQGRLRYPDRTPFNVTTPISVNHGEYTTYSRAIDGTFTVPNVPPGIYLVEVHSATHHFSQVKCQFKPDAEAEGKPIFSCIEYFYAGAQKIVQSPENLLTITALATFDYFEVKRGFSFASILKNPMVLISKLGVLYYCMVLFHVDCAFVLTLMTLIPFCTIQSSSLLSTLALCFSGVHGWYHVVHAQDDGGFGSGRTRQNAKTNGIAAESNQNVGRTLQRHDGWRRAGKTIARQQGQKDQKVV